MSRREISILLLMCLVWGFHFIVVKTAVTAVPPIFYAAMRMTLVALIMSPFLRWRPGQMIKVLAAGVCLGALNYAFMFTGIRHATASASAVAIELYVPFATIMSVIFLGEHVGWKRTAGIAMAVIGVAIIALTKGEAKMTVGVILVAVAAFSEAVGAIFVKKLRGFTPLQLLAWFSLIGAMLLWPTSLVFESGQGDALRERGGAMLYGAIVYSAIGASIFGHGAYYWLLQRLPISQVASTTLLTTLVAIVLGVVLLDDPVGPQFFIGGLIALAGVGVILMRSDSRVPTDPTPTKSTIAEPGEQNETDRNAVAKFR